MHPILRGKPAQVQPLTPQACTTRFPEVAAQRMGGARLGCCAKTFARCPPTSGRRRSHGLWLQSKRREPPPDSFRTRRFRCCWLLLLLLPAEPVGKRSHWSAALRGNALQHVADCLPMLMVTVGAQRHQRTWLHDVKRSVHPRLRHRRKPHGLAAPPLLRKCWLPRLRQGQQNRNCSLGEPMRLRRAL